MNNTEHNTEESHEGPIKTPKQLIVTVVLSFIVPVLIIFLLIRLVVSDGLTGAGSDAQTPDAIAARIQPVAGFALVDANAPKVFKTGKQVYDTVCASCHAAGVAGAPKLGDKTAWGPLVKSGLDTMVNNAIKGKNAMPAKGGNPMLDDFEIARAVVFMANESGGSFDEPKEPAAEGKAAAAAPAVATAPAAAPTPKAAAPVTPAPATAPAASAPVASAPVAAAAAVNPAGEKLYKTACFACHDMGVAGAPKLGDKAAWAPVIATGLDAMVKNVISGKGVMPPRGGTAASDDDIRAAVQFMVSKAQ